MLLSRSALTLSITFSRLLIDGASVCTVQRHRQSYYRTLNKAIEIRHDTTWRIFTCAQKLTYSQLIPAIMSSPFFNPTTSPCTVYVYTDFCRRAFSYSFPATRNSIPISIKSCSSLHSFKRHLKSYFIAQLINN